MQLFIFFEFYQIPFKYCLNPVPIHFQQHCLFRPEVNLMKFLHIRWQNDPKKQTEMSNSFVPAVLFSKSTSPFSAKFCEVTTKTETRSTSHRSDKKFSLFPVPKFTEIESRSGCVPVPRIGGRIRTPPRYFYEEDLERLGKRKPQGTPFAASPWPGIVETRTVPRSSSSLHRY